MTLTLLVDGQKPNFKSKNLDGKNSKPRHVSFGFKLRLVYLQVFPLFYALLQYYLNTQDALYVLKYFINAALKYFWWW